MQHLLTDLHTGQRVDQHETEEILNHVPWNGDEKNIG